MKTTINIIVTTIITVLAISNLFTNNAYAQMKCVSTGGVGFVITKKSALYEEPYAHRKIKGRYIAPQQVLITERCVNYYKIKTWIGDKFIYINDHHFLSNLHLDSKNIAITKETQLYTLPFSEYKTNVTLSPQKNIKAMAIYKGWTRVSTWLGDRWVKL